MDASLGRIALEDSSNPVDGYVSATVANPTTLCDIVVDAQNGDAFAQRQLYDDFRHRVLGLAFRIVGPDDADDVTQQVFLQVFRQLKQFAGHSRFETWLIRICINECRQVLRKRSRRPWTTLDPDYQAAVEPDRSCDHRDLLEHALRQLEPELRTVFLLREKEELSYAEIAEATETSEGTVASRLNRARRQLQRTLIELGWEP